MRSQRQCSTQDTTSTFYRWCAYYNNGRLLTVLFVFLCIERIFPDISNLKNTVHVSFMIFERDTLLMILIIWLVTCYLIPRMFLSECCSVACTVAVLYCAMCNFVMSICFALHALHENHVYSTLAKYKRKKKKNPEP